MGRGAQTQRSERFKTEKEFASHVLEVQTLLDTIARKLQSGDAVGAEWDALLKEKEILLTLDPVMRQRFTEREQAIIAAGVPAVILDRHHATVANYEKSFQVLIDNLSQTEGARRGRSGDFLDKIKAAHGHLEQRKSKDPPPFLSSSPLSDGSHQQVGGLTAMAAHSDQRERSIEETLAAGPSLPLESVKKKAPVLDINAAVPPPRAEARAPASLPANSVGPGDLNPTIDVQITQEVIDLAASLGNSPARIYQHVRDTFPFEPYLGSRKGSRETLLAGSGNDYDLASLLIALLRAANVPCRYVAGTVLLSADQAMQWLGVTDPGTAADLLATAGIEGTAYTSGGQITAISLKHVWVRAYVPYGNYRGIPNDATGKMWVPLDPSFKLSDYPPAVDIPTEMGFNAQAFIDNYISTFHTLSPVELYLQQIQTYVTANHPELTYPSGVFRRGTVTPDQLGLLPGALPYKLLSKDDEYTEIPAAKRHQIRFRISDNFGSPLLDHTVNLPTIASKRVTICYIAATPADQATIEAFGDLYLTPPDLIDLKPVLKVDGTAVATGGSIGAGILHSSDMFFMAPVGEGNPVPVIHNSITAGTYQGIGIDTYGVPPSVLLPSQSGPTPDTDGLTGEKLYRTAMSYLDRVDRSGAAVAQTMQMVALTAVSEAIVENVILVSYSFGSPVGWEWRGLVVDADRKIIGPFSIDGTTSKEKPYFVLAGADGSIQENRVFEDTFNEQAVSTIKILELANDMSVATCRIVTSIAANCPGISQPASVISAINSALTHGHTVTIPRTGITYHQWQGTGYIDMDPTTGAAGYIISGGQSGGATVDLWLSTWDLIFAILFRDVCNITAVITSPAPNQFFPYPGFLAGFFSSEPSQFDVDYTVSYCDDGSELMHETFRPHYQYPPGDYIFYAGYGTGATLPFTIFDVEIQMGGARDSDHYMGKGYTGAPVDGDPKEANIYYVIKPSTFTPKEVKLMVSQGGALLTMTLPNSSGEQTVEFDGKKDDGTFFDAGSYKAKIKVIAPNDRQKTSDDHDLQVVEVTKVELLTAAGGALDANKHPTKPGGLRIFTGRTAPAAGSRNDTAKVRVTLSAAVPAGKLKVHLLSFDLEDPTGLINANHGSALGTSAEGDFSDDDPPTDGDDKVDVDFTVTMQPGDNFKVFASTNEELLLNMTDAIVKATTDAMGATTDARLMPLASEQLTVWRRVHAERDSMGTVTGNVVSGNITAVAAAGAGKSMVTTNQNVTETPTAANRFEHGVLKNAGHSFSVISNTQGANFTVTVNNLGAVVPANGAFTLVDDDDFNSSDGAALDGDAGEDVTNVDTTLIQDSDDGAKNVFAFAYVRPTFDVGDNNSNVLFVLNTPDGANEDALLIATYDFDQVATEADPDFWTVYLLGAYQMQTEEDGDPASENGGASTLGQVDTNNGKGVSVFKETSKEAAPGGGTCAGPGTLAHELGHLFKGEHPDGGLMAGSCGPSLSFTNASLTKIRNLDHP
jgi:hypothetical protein